MSEAAPYRMAPLLLRTALRRDRVLVGVWVIVLVGLVVASAAATPGLYPTVEARVRASEALNNTPAVVALYGPIMEPGSLGELSMSKMTVLYSALVAALGLVVVRRHLRAEEESGRTELIGATLVGRRAAMLAALAECVLVASAVGVLAFAASAVCGLPVLGSAVFGASWALTGIVFGAVSAVCCQLSASTRTCGLIAGGVLAGAYLVRMVGDMTETSWSWLSPIGWNTQVRAWADHPRWWVLVLYPVLAVVLAAVAARLADGRDLGSGLLAPRSGATHGSRGLRGPMGLLVRTSAGSWFAWAVGLALVGMLLGSLTPGITRLLDTQQAQDMVRAFGGPGAVVDAMVVTLFGMLAVVVTGFAVSLTSHWLADERDGRTELVLATRVTRTRHVAALLAATLGGTAGLLLLLSVAVGAGYAVAGGGDSSAGAVMAGGVVQVPAVWVTCAVAVLLAGVWPHAPWAGWVPLLGFVVLGQFGRVLHLPDWVRDLSPYAHTPGVPGSPMDWVSLAALTAVAVVLVAAAVWRHRARDIG